jgi:hypothetical protein
MLLYSTDALASDECQEVTDFFWQCGHHITWAKCRNPLMRLKRSICNPGNGCSIQQHPPRFLSGLCTWCMEMPQNPEHRGIRSHPGCNVLPPGELVVQREHMEHLREERDRAIVRRREEERRSTRRLRAESWWQERWHERYAKEVEDGAPALQRTYYFTPDGYSNLFADPEISNAELFPESCGICREIFGEPGQSEPVMLPCKHNFHLECIRQWFWTPSRSCPLCRTEFRVARFVWRDDQKQPAGPERHWLNSSSF